MEDAMHILQQAEDMVKLRIQKDEDNIGKIKAAGCHTSVILQYSFAGFKDPLIMNQTIYINPQTCQKNNYDMQYLSHLAIPSPSCKCFYKHFLIYIHWKLHISKFYLKKRKDIFFLTILSSLTKFESKLCENANESLLVPSILCAKISDKHLENSIKYPTFPYNKLMIYLLKQKWKWEKQHAFKI